jgi:hypothetical protein
MDFFPFNRFREDRRTSKTMDAQANVPLQDLLSRIGKLEQELAGVVRQIGTLRNTLKAAHKGLSASPYPIAQLDKVRKQLRALHNLSFSVDVEALAAAADLGAETTATAFRVGFRRQLQVAAEASGMAFEVVGEDTTVGPFKVEFEPAKGQAALNYGKAVLVEGLPADAAKIVAAAGQVASDLFDKPATPAALAAEFEQAVTIALTRAKTSLRTPELRAELPSIYREMTFIRQTAKPALTAKTFREYSLAKFVVELATLVRSDENVQADRSFRLETAVIENAGNRRKSIFIPNNLKRSFGEGMYFQAIVLRQQV